MHFLLHHLTQEIAARTPHADCLVDHETRLDFASTSKRASALAAGLQERGIHRGDRVAIYLKPEIALPLAILGVSMSGAAFVPIHHGLFPAQIAHIINDSGASLLITDDGRLHKLQDVLSSMKTLRHAVVVGNPPEKQAGELPVVAMDELCSGASHSYRELGIGKDLGAILYTSGSTGLPKGVMLSHANLIAGAEIVANYLSLSGADRLLAALPFSFDAGLNQFTSAQFVGGTTVMTDFRFARDIVRRLAEEKITGLAGVPSLWSLLAQPSSGLANRPLPDLRYITNTGGAMPQTVLAQLRKMVPDVEIFLMYGLTEAFRSTFLPPDQLDTRPTSMGKAIPNTEILVIDEAGQPCKPGEIGELVHHGPTVSLGYWNQPELTRNVLRPHPLQQPGRADRDLVCYSGDLVKQDAEGFLFFVGRRDNQIKSAGFRISPTEVEAVICASGPIRQAAVIGVPDPILGQHLIAFGVPEEGAGEIDGAQILVVCARNLPRHMVPKEMRLVTELPATTSGKVDYPALRQSVSNKQPRFADTA